MKNNFSLILDTEMEYSPSVLINSSQTHLLLAKLADGHQMKIWGDVDNSDNDNIQTLEENSIWIPYSTNQTIRFSIEDGVKNIYVRVRDDVYNESTLASDSTVIVKDKPLVDITCSDILKISKVEGKNQISFSFMAITAQGTTCVGHKIKVVESASDTHDKGTLIGMRAGSINMSNSVELYETNIPVNCIINGQDLELASSGDNAKIIKVFIQDSAGKWSE